MGIDESFEALAGRAMQRAKTCRKKCDTLPPETLLRSPNLVLGQDLCKSGHSRGPEKKHESGRDS